PSRRNGHLASTRLVAVLAARLRPLDVRAFRAVHAEHACARGLPFTRADRAAGIAPAGDEIAVVGLGAERHAAPACEGGPAGGLAREPGRVAGGSPAARDLQRQQIRRRKNGREALVLVERESAEGTRVTVTRAALPVVEGVAVYILRSEGHRRVRGERR